MPKLFSNDKFQEKWEQWEVRVNLFLLACSLIVVIWALMSRVFVSESGLTDSGPSKRDFCSLITQQMIQKKLSPKLMTDSLFELVTRDNYASLYFSGKEKVTGIWSNDDSCKVLVSGESFRSFDLKLEMDGGYPFYYVVVKISENELFEKEEE